MPTTAASTETTAAAPASTAEVAPAGAGSSELPPASALAPDKIALIEALPSDVQCPVPPIIEAPAPGVGEEVLVVARARDGCLVNESTVIPSAELDVRVAEALAEPDVVAADRATYAVSLSTDQRQIPVDPPIEDQRWWLEDLHVDRLDALAVNTAVPEVRVAVIDDGIATHPDLDALVHDGDRRSGIPESSTDHGTHVAGVIAALADNGRYGRGVARGIDLLDVPEAASLAELVEWAVARGARVINMSIVEATADGAIRRPNAVTEAAMRYARRRSVLLIAAVGNCGTGQRGYQSGHGPRQCRSLQNTPIYPAAYDGVLGVGAYSSTPERTPADFSSRNFTVDLSAPGTHITSTSSVDPTGLRSMWGTSQAAPMVTGVAAALLAHRPDLRPDQIEGALEATAAPVGGQRDNDVGHGRIDPAAAIDWLDANSPPAELTLATLQGARVPGLCEHPPGLLVDGARPDIPRERGGVWMDGRVPIAVGDVNGDGIADAAAVVSCNQGGVAWPEHIVVYTTGGLLVGAVDLGSLTDGAARATVGALAYVDGRFDVAWLTNQSGDPDCCPTREVSTSITIVDQQVVPGAVVDGPGAPAPAAPTLVSCEGVDLTPVSDIGAFVGLTDSTCSAPWALVAFTEAAPSVSVALLRYDETTNGTVVTYWTHLELGDNPDYTPAAIAAEGVPLDVATAMYERLGGASAGNQTGRCATRAFAADTGVETETADCDGNWGIGVPVDCGDQCEHVEVFELVGGRWVARGGTHSLCPDFATATGMPVDVARRLIPSFCDDDTDTAGAPTSTLSRDDTGPAVARLQAALVAAGYAVDVDSRFGAGTEQAVIDFQRASGLVADGIAGPATQRALGMG